MHLCPPYLKNGPLRYVFVCVCGYIYLRVHAFLVMFMRLQVYHQAFFFRNVLKSDCIVGMVHSPFQSSTLVSLFLIRQDQTTYVLSIGYTKPLFNFAAASRFFTAN